MILKLLVAVTLSITVPVIAFAQKASPTKTAPKPTIAQVRKLVQMISSNKAKLKAYCDANQLEQQIEEAERQKDSQALEALNAKADALERQISSEYTKVMDGLEEVDPNSAEGKQFATVINTLMKQCK
jgi:hypothetical protein